MNKYKKKQLKISLIYLLILIIIAGGIYLLIKPKLPSCSDGIQNQGEAGIDCGGPCPLCFWQLQNDLEVIFVQAIKTENNNFDLVAKIKNPNQDFGAKSFSYLFNLYDQKDELAFSKQGESYILPQEIRYIIEQKVLTDSKISRAELKITHINWQKLVDYREPELLIRNSNFEQSEDSSQAFGTLENRSNYDFDKIDIYAILFGRESKILGVGKMNLRTVSSKENRYFELSWFFPISNQIENIDITARTNIFLDKNFMKRYGEDREEFQEY